jgi:hypothetical protein
MINSIDWTHAYDDSLPSSKPTRISVLGPDAMSNKSEYVAAKRVARTQRSELIVWRAGIDALMSGTVVSNHLVAPTRARFRSRLSYALIAHVDNQANHVTSSPHQRRRSAREEYPIPSHAAPAPMRARTMHA